MALDVKEVQYVWRTFFKSRPNNVYSWSYDDFSPPWYDEKTMFVRGKDVLVPFETGAKTMPPLHEIRTFAKRKIACCILMTWARLEEKTSWKLQSIRDGVEVNLRHQTRIEFADSVKHILAFRTLFPGNVPSDATLDAFLSLLPTLARKSYDLSFASFG